MLSNDIPRSQVAVAEFLNFEEFTHGVKKRKKHEIELRIKIYDIRNDQNTQKPHDARWTTATAALLLLLSAFRSGRSAQKETFEFSVIVQFQCVAGWHARGRVF